MPVDEGMLRSTLQHSLNLLCLQGRKLSIANATLENTRHGNLKLNSEIRAQITALAAEVYLLTDFVEQLRRAGVKE